MSAWDDCLDALAAHLAEQRSAVADGRPEDVRAFVPPTGLGPVPASLAARLRSLAAQADALTRSLTGASAAAARQLQLVAVLHSPQQVGASFVDARG